MNKVNDKFINITDVTLREGDQAPLTSFSASEKSIIALMLSELGVDTIEVGFGFSRVDKDNIEKVSSYFKNRDTVLSSLGRALETDTIASLEALETVKNPRIHIFLAMSKDHINGKFKKESESLDETRNRLILTAINEIKRAKSWGKEKDKKIEIEFSPEDATGNSLIDIEGKKYFRLKNNPDFDFLVNVCEEAIKSGATVINVPDTLGNLLPNQTYKFFRELKNRLSYLEKNYNFGLSCHIHNDLGTSTANAIESLRGGAKYIESTLFGIGERAGNTSTEEVIGIISEKGHDIVESKEIKLNPKIKTELIGPISDFVKSILGFDKTLQKPFVGALSDVDGSGVHNANGDLYGGSKNKAKFRGSVLPEFFSPRGGANQVVNMLSKNNIILNKSSNEIKNITLKAAGKSEINKALYDNNIFALYLQEYKGFKIKNIDFNNNNLNINIVIDGREINFIGEVKGKNGIIKTFTSLLNAYFGKNTIKVEDLLVKSRANLHQEYKKFSSRVDDILSDDFRDIASKILSESGYKNEYSNALAVSQVVLDISGVEVYSISSDNNTTKSQIKAILEGVLPLIIEKENISLQN